MYNTLSKPKKYGPLVYLRVGSKAQLAPNKPTSQINMGHQIIRIGDTPYILPKQLKEPVYHYNSHRFNAHNVIKEHIKTSKIRINELKALESSPF